MNILYISYDGMTDPLGQSQVIPYIIGLTRKGYNFTILSYEKKERYGRFKNEIEKQLNSEKIIWKPFRYHKNFSLVSTCYDLFRGFIYLLYYLPKEDIRIIHCRSYIASVLGLVFKKIYKTKFIFDMRGFWADERVDGGVFKKGYIYKILKNLEKQFIKSADATISLTQNAIEEMKKWQYVNDPIKQKFINISTCCDIKKFDNSYRHNIKKEFDREHINFIYIGSIGPWQSFREITGFIKYIYKYLPSSAFTLIVSYGKEEFIKFIEKEQLCLSRFNINTLTYNEIPYALKNADIGFFFKSPTFANIACFPTKMGEMLAAGIPIITGHSIGDVDELIIKYEIGYILKSFGDDQYKTAIDFVISLIAGDKAKLHERCMQVGEKYFSLEKGLEKYHSVYEKIHMV